MEVIFPRLKAAFDPNRKSDTKYGGAVVLKRMWDYLNCEGLLSSAGIQKRSGIPTNGLAFNYVLKPLMDARSIKRVNRRTRGDGLLKGLIPDHDQCTLNRFINGNYNWDLLNEFRILELQRRRRTRTLEDGLIVLDDVVIQKFGKRMENIAYVWSPVAKKTVLGYNPVVLLYTDEEKSYPLNFAFKTKENDKITLATQLIERLKELKVRAKCVVFDTWYFALKLITTLRDHGLFWVTKSKKNRIFVLNGAEMHAEEIIQSGIKETVAELLGYGPVKVVVAEINEKSRLLVTSDLEMKGRKVVKVYRDRFKIDNPFFRDGKQEMGLEDFHTRKFKALIAHTVMCFLSHTLVSLIKLFDRKLFDKTTGWIKENLFKVVAGVKAVREGIRVTFGKGLKFISALSHTIPS